MRPIDLQVIAPTLQGMGLCSACELVLSEAGGPEAPVWRSIDEYPAEWQEENRRLADWVYTLADRYGDRILIRVIDPQSPEGLFKSLRYRARRTPTWIVNGRTRIVGWDRDALEAALREAGEA